MSEHDHPDASEPVDDTVEAEVEGPDAPEEVAPAATISTTQAPAGADSARPTWRPYAIGAAAALLAVGLFFGGYLVGSLGDDDTDHDEARSGFPSRDFDFRIPGDLDRDDLRDFFTDRDDEALAESGFLGVEVSQTAGGELVIQGVEPGTAADEAGLEEGDVIVAIDGDDVESVPELANRIRDLGAGTAIELTIERDGGERTLDVTLGSRA